MGESNKKLRWHKAPQRDGAAVVEFALIAPLFFMLVLGCIELGRGMMVQQVLTNASRAGAREASTPNTTEVAAEDAAKDYASGAGVTGSTVTITPNPATAGAGEMITVTVSVDFANASWTPAPWFLGNTTLTATSAMRKEGFD